MTNQEAILILKAKHHDTYDLRLWEAVNKAISALEKEIPKKPARIDKDKKIVGNWKMVCPTCGRIFVERITTPEESYTVLHNLVWNCSCGQTIDWEEYV